MYWAISLTYTLLGTVIFWIILSNKWNKMDRLAQLSLQQLSVFHQIPHHPEYLDLKFSIVRHSFAFLLSSALIYWVKSDFVLTAILIINFLYCWLPISRYRYRKRDLAETASRQGGEATAHFLAIPVKDSFCVIVHSVICLALTFLLYAIRP